MLNSKPYNFVVRLLLASVAVVLIGLWTAPKVHADEEHDARQQTEAADALSR